MQLVRRVKNAARSLLPRAVILLYHRVANPHRDPQLLCVSPKHFAEHLDVLRRHYRAMPLLDVVHRLRHGWLPPRTVVITFDDGYADNLFNAKPMLERYDVPATVFVTSGYIGAAREFFWDDLERILLGTTPLPHSLELMVQNQRYQWKLAENSTTQRHTDRDWNLLCTDACTDRQVIYRALVALARELSSSARDQLIAEVVAWAGVSAAGRPENLALSHNELRKLAQDGLIEIGAHTVSHPRLAALTPHDQALEIQNGKRQLEMWLERPILSFAYPFGWFDDYTAETRRLVRQAGFACACSNFGGWARWGIDPYQLPRYLVRNWNGEEFAKRLAQWFVD